MAARLGSRTIRRDGWDRSLESGARFRRVKWSTRGEWGEIPTRAITHPPGEYGGMTDLAANRGQITHRYGADRGPDSRTSGPTDRIGVVTTIIQWMLLTHALKPRENPGALTGGGR